MSESDEAMSDPARRRSRRKRDSKRQNLTTRQKKRQKARACEIAGDESDCAAYGYGSPDRLKKVFTNIKEYASKFKEAAFIPPVFYTFVRRLSNVKVKILMHKRVNGEDRYVLFLGEIHKNIRGGDTPIGEIVIPFLENATEHVDFMFEEDPRNSQVKFVRTSEPYILEDLRDRLKPYVLKTKQFQSARVHWVDLIWPIADVNGKEIPGDRADRLRRFLTLIFDTYFESNDETLFKYYKHSVQILMFLKKYGNLTDNLNRLDDTERKKAILMACLKVLRVPGEGRHIDTFTSCNFLDDDTYFEIFNSLATQTRELDQILMDIHRFLMDIYTCCRIMKTDPGWYKNVVVYAGAMHTQRCVSIMLEYGFTAKRIHYKRQL